MTQTAIATALGITQGNVSFYERGQTIPPAVAGRLIELAKGHALVLTFDPVYGGTPLPAVVEAEKKSSRSAAKQAA